MPFIHVVDSINSQGAVRPKGSPTAFAPNIAASNFDVVGSKVDVSSSEFLVTALPSKLRASNIHV